VKVEIGTRLFRRTCTNIGGITQKRKLGNGVIINLPLIRGVHAGFWWENLGEEVG
jgi:hypothetical protein